MKSKPTASQLRVLRNIAAGLGANFHCRSMSDYGGLRGTLASLHRRGWLQNDQITEAGRQAIAGASGTPRSDTP